MSECMQAPGMNMIQHGETVHQKYIELIQKLNNGNFKEKTLQEYYNSIKDGLPEPGLLENYHIYHDCGKHLCLKVDDLGRRHFPEHAHYSYLQYKHLFPNDNFTCDLISKDMEFHILRGDKLLELWMHEHAHILYLTAWSEIYANAQMFGGEESESFKIKKSRLNGALKKFNQLKKETT